MTLKQEQKCLFLEVCAQNKSKRNEYYIITLYPPPWGKRWGPVIPHSPPKKHLADGWIDIDFDCINSFS